MVHMFPSRGDAKTQRSSPSWAVIGIFLLLLIAGIAYARDFLMPVALAFLLALVFSPVRRFLERRRVPAEASAVLIVGSLYLVGETIGLLESGEIAGFESARGVIMSPLDA